MKHVILFCSLIAPGLLALDSDDYYESNGQEYSDIEKLSFYVKLVDMGYRPKYTPDLELIRNGFKEHFKTNSRIVVVDRFPKRTEDNELIFVLELIHSGWESDDLERTFINMKLLRMVPDPKHNGRKVLVLVQERNGMMKTNHTSPEGQLYFLKSLITSFMNQVKFKK